MWIVTGLVIVGLIARLVRFHESLWYDEIVAWLWYGQQGPQAIVTTFHEPANHILHTLLTSFSVSALGDSALRLPALLFSLATIVCVYGLVRMTVNLRTAIIAGAIMAISPVAVLEGVEARGYSMMMCFATLAMWLFAALRRRESALLWGGYILVCTLGVWTHFVTAFVPIGHAIWLGWRAVVHRQWRRSLRGGVAIALAGLCSIMLYLPILDDIGDQWATYVPADGGSPGIFGPEGLHLLLQCGGSWYWWAALPGLVLLSLGMVFVTRSRSDGADAQNTDELPAALSALLGLPILIAIVALAGSWMYARFALFAFPATVVLIAIGIDCLFSRYRTIGIAALSVFLMGGVVDLAVRPAKQPLADAAAYVRAEHRPDDSIVVIGLAHRVMDVYLAHLEPTYSRHHGENLADVLAAVNPDWVIIYYPRSVASDRLQMLADRGFERVATFPGWVDWNNGDVIVMRRHSGT